MRVVIDTNVFVGALLSADGANRQVIRACLNGRLTPLFGMALFAEYESVIARDNLFANSPLNRSERFELFDALLSVGEWASIYFIWRPNLRDEADNHVVELAAAGRAQTIVTNNVRDFAGEHMEFLGIRVLTPQALLAELEN